VTEFRQLETRDFNPVLAVAPTDFEALFAYKRGDYRRCLQLSTDNARLLTGVEGISGVSVAYPEFIQLMDDNIASLIGLTLIADPSLADQSWHFILLQLSLSLYLMAQCQIKLHHSVSALASTLNYVIVAREDLDEDLTLDQLLLKLTEHKIMRYVKTELGYR